jgi:hypothetical protein
MTLAARCLMVLAVAVPATAHAELITAPFRTVASRLRNRIGTYTLIREGDFQQVELDNVDVRLPSFTGQIDSTAQTGQLLNMNFTSAAIPQTVTEHKFVVGPPVFPDPAPTGTWRVTIERDPLPMPLPDFMSSSVEPFTSIPHPSGVLYDFRPSLQIAAPESFSISGRYTIEGPSTTVGPISFAHTFTRVTPATVTMVPLARVEPGSNFPTTAKYTIGFPEFSFGTYRLDAPAVYEHTVDGAAFRLAVEEEQQLRSASVPEPTATALAVSGVCALAAVRRRVQRCRGNLTLSHPLAA